MTTPRRATGRSWKALLAVLAACAALLLTAAPASASTPTIQSVDATCLPNGDVSVTITATVGRSRPAFGSVLRVEVVADGTVIYTQDITRAQGSNPPTIVVTDIVPGSVASVIYVVRTFYVASPGTPSETVTSLPRVTDPVTVETGGICGASSTPEGRLALSATRSAGGVDLFVEGCDAPSASVAVDGQPAGSYTPDGNGSFNAVLGVQGSGSVAVTCGSNTGTTTIVGSAPAPVQPNPSGPAATSTPVSTPGAGSGSGSSGGGASGIGSGSVSWWNTIKTGGWGAWWGSAGSTGASPWASYSLADSSDVAQQSVGGAEVLGASGVRADVSSVAQGGSPTLPRTGSNTADMLRVALLLVTVGGLMVFGGQRIRSRRTIDIG